MYFDMSAYSLVGMYAQRDVIGMLANLVTSH